VQFRASGKGLAAALTDPRVAAARVRQSSLRQPVQLHGSVAVQRINSHAGRAASRSFRRVIRATAIKSELRFDPWRCPQAGRAAFNCADLPKTFHARRQNVAVLQAFLDPTARKPTREPSPGNGPNAEPLDHASERRIDLAELDIECP